MIPFRTNWLTILILSVFAIGIIGYAYFEARNIISGPTIELTSSEEKITVTEQLILIKGTASNITELRMNGRIVSTTEAGAFEEAHLLATGYNKIILSATDKTGRETTKAVEVVYSPTESPSEEDGDL